MTQPPLDTTILPNGLAARGIITSAHIGQLVPASFWQDGKCHAEMPDRAMVRAAVERVGNDKLYLDENTYIPGDSDAVAFWEFDRPEDAQPVMDRKAIVNGWIRDVLGRGGVLWTFNDPFGGDYAAMQFTSEQNYRRVVMQRWAIAGRTNRDMYRGRLVKGRNSKYMDSINGGILLGMYYQQNTSIYTEMSDEDAWSVVHQGTMEIATGTGWTGIPLVRVCDPTEPSRLVPLPVCQRMVDECPVLGVWEDRQDIPDDAPMLAVLRGKYPVRQPYRPPARTGTM